MIVTLVHEIVAKQDPVTHQQARDAARALIDEHFHNGKYRTKFSIPVEPDDTDVLLMAYIEQQEQKEQVKGDEG